MKEKEKKKKKRRRESPKASIMTKERCVFATGIFLLGFLCVTGVLVYRTVFKAEEYRKKADEDIVNEMEIKAKRGRILDRNGHSLAVSGDVYRVDIDIPTLFRTFDEKADSKKEKDKKSAEGHKEFLAQEMAKILEVEKEVILNLFDKKLESGEKATSAIVARRISKEKADAIKALKYYGVIISSDTKRYYPNDEFSSYVIGNVNSDGEGLNGIEMYYNSILSGVSGVRIAALDGERSLELPLEKSSFTPAVNGKDIVLTIDEKIQYFAEKAAEEALAEHDADSVSILISDPNTNEILALASGPDYNPNKPYEGFEKFQGETESDKIQQMWRNKIVSDTYEPGSTFKIITAAAAIEEGVANNGETYVCNGYRIIDGQRINCWKREGHGPQTFNQIIENSCNMGLIDLGEKLGAEKLSAYIDKFGFGKETGIDITGESVGIIKKLEDITPVDLATISFGQTNAVTMVQLMTGFNASINGGYIMKPHLMKDVTSTTRDGALVINDSYKIEKQSVISEETSSTIRNTLEGVVKNGTGKTAYVEGFRVIGKTGTAQKVKESGGYGEGRVASFIAAAPADNPKISILVTIDNPKKGVASGSSMAGPVVRNLLESIYSYNDVSKVDFTSTNDTNIIMSEVRELSKNKAKEILEKEGLIVKFSGNGENVKSIDILPGSLVKKGSTVNVELTKGSNKETKVVVPDFTGYSKEMVESVCTKIGLVPKFDIPSGNVNLQSIEKGQTIRNGDSIKFILEQNKEN